MAERAFPDALPPDYRLHWYTLLRVLGQGGFGITYLGRDTNLDQLVAIKEFLPVDMATRLADASVRFRTEELRERYRWGLERFIQEARTLAKFDHPNIVRVHSVFEANDTAYMVMRFEEGQNLASQLERRGTLPEPELQRILLSILDGLELVHNAGFIHRDIKPDNIHIRSDGTPVLLDFGSARHSIGKARTMTILVAPGYAPIEQYYSDAQSQGPWTDIYGLAATCYRALAGVAPLDAIARSKGILGSADDVLVPASVIGRGRYSERLLTAIDHGLAFAEKDRPQNIADWRREILPEPVVNAAALPKAMTTQADPAVAVAPPAPNAVPKSPARPSFPLAAVAWSVAGAAAAALTIAVLLRVQAPDPESERRLAEARTQIEIERLRLAEERKRDEIERVQLAEVRQREEKKREDDAAERQRAAQAQQPEQPKRTVPEPPRKTVETKKPEVEMKRPEPKRQTDIAPARSLAEIPTMREPVRGVPAVVSAGPQIVLTELEPAETTPTVPLALAPKAPLAPPQPTPAVRLAEAEKLEARGDVAAALKIVLALADQGNARAQTKLANSYSAGRGVTRDDAAALTWYRKAAAQGDSEAQLQLGHHYAEGRGVPKNANQAYIWYSLAARSGVPAAVEPRKKALAQLQPAEIAQADRVVETTYGRREPAR